VSIKRFVVMGVSGCGKTSIGLGLASALGADFIDGDDLHPPSNVAKMARGEPLDDADRAPWLAAVAERLAQSERPLIIGCSALRRRYRDWIRDGAGGEVTFLHLSGTRDVIAARMDARKGHFMPLSLLDSQFAALEPPEADEASITVDIDQTEAEIVAELVQLIASKPLHQG
jgi:gluconokinase